MKEGPFSHEGRTPEVDSWRLTLCWGSCIALSLVLAYAGAHPRSKILSHYLHTGSNSPYKGSYGPYASSLKVNYHSPSDGQNRPPPRVPACFSAGSLHIASAARVAGRAWLACLVVGMPSSTTRSSSLLANAPDCKASVDPGP